MKDNMWIVILVVCIVGGMLYERVKPVVFRRIRSRGWAFVVAYVVFAAIFMALYGIAALLGFSVWQ